MFSLSTDLCAHHCCTHKENPTPRGHQAQQGQPLAAGVWVRLCGPAPQTPGSTQFLGEDLAPVTWQVCVSSRLWHMSPIHLFSWLRRNIPLNAAVARCPFACRRVRGLPVSQVEAQEVRRLRGARQTEEGGGSCRGPPSHCGRGPRFKAPGQDLFWVAVCHPGSWVNCGKQLPGLQVARGSGVGKNLSPVTSLPSVIS